MKITRGLYNWQNIGSCVATIGNFDGVHVGHQYLLQQLNEQSIIYDLPSLVITFEPPPNVYFQHTPIRLMTLSSKLHALQHRQIDHVVCLHFNKKFEYLTAEEFVKAVLVDILSIKLLIIGDDFHFGYQRGGNVALLQQLAKQYGFAVQQLSSHTIDGQRVSSTYIRNLLQQGQLDQARLFLGKYYAIRGRVIHGDQRGRLLGFPTANIAISKQLTPLSGVYVVQVEGIKTNSIKGVANIGCRPTVDGKQQLLEVHLFDFDDTIYGKEINVQFLHKLRDEQRFASIDELQQRIGYDKQQAKLYFEERVI